MEKKTKTSARPTLKGTRRAPMITGAKVALPTLAACLASALSAAAQQTSASADAAAKSTSLFPPKPAWLTDLSVGVKESWDNNVFLVSGEGTNKQSSFLTTVSPKIGVNLAPLMGGQQFFQVLAFGYAPDFVVYHDVGSESYDAHRFATTVKGKTDNFSLSLDNSFNYIDGNDHSPFYTGSDADRSAYATAAPRERREQIQDRAKFSMQYDMGNFFVRPTASTIYYDLMTAKLVYPKAMGYQNYSDRYDVNGGVDYGYKVTKDVALTLGYRYGRQYQEQFSRAIDGSQLSASSDYQRVLVGIEGKPLKWLTVSVLEGPDFRSYDPSVTNAAGKALHTASISDRHPIKNYGEAAITADISSSDSLSFKYKQWQWVSSTGKLPLLESTYDLGYRHKFTKDFSADAGFKLGTSDYNCGNQASSERDDWMYTFTLGLNYNVTANLALNAGYQVDLGRNKENVDPVDGNFRQFDHHLVSLGAVFKF